MGVISIVRATSNSKKQNYIDLNIANNSTEKDTQVPTRIEPVTTAPSASEPATDAPTLPAAQVQDETPVQVNAPVFSFNDGSSLVWPVDGDVILGYNFRLKEKQLCNYYACRSIRNFLSKENNSFFK